MLVRALWDPGWYNLDQSLKAGRRDTFALLDTAHSPGYDMVLANSLGTPPNYRSAIVHSIDHHHFGAVAEVDTRPFGQYTFTLADGRWVTIEAEQDPGVVNDASPGFPTDQCDPAWAGNGGWALTVVFSDVTPASAPT